MVALLYNSCTDVTVQTTNLSLATLATVYRIFLYVTNKAALQALLQNFAGYKRKHSAPRETLKCDRVLRHIEKGWSGF